MLILAMSEKSETLLEEIKSSQADSEPLLLAKGTYVVNPHHPPCAREEEILAVRAEESPAGVPEQPVVKMTL